MKTKIPFTVHICSCRPLQSHPLSTAKITEKATTSKHGHSLHWWRGCWLEGWVVRGAEIYRWEGRAVAKEEGAGQERKCEDADGEGRRAERHMDPGSPTNSKAQSGLQRKEPGIRLL